MTDATSSAAIGGAIELLLGRRDGLKRFDLTVEGFWRSFGAIVFVLPFYAVVIAGDWKLISSQQNHPPLSAVVAAQLILLAAQWVGAPFVLALLAKRLGITRTYVAYVVVNNWACVVAIAPMALVSMALGLGLVPIMAAELLWLILNIGIIFYQYRITRWTLDWSAGAAAGLVAAELGLGLILGLIVDRLLGV